MKRFKITTRNKNWFFISIGITLLGYAFSLDYVMLIGLGCLIFVVVDFLADNVMLKSK